MDIFLDESGYTGPDLINQDQPVFVLASTVIGASEAKAILDEHFGNTRPEVKYSRLSNSGRGRAQILAFLAGLKLDQRNAALWAVHKEFILLTHLIDFWLEPMLYQDGVNLYARGANIALANVSYITLGTCLGRDGRREILRRFQVMTRDRTRFAYHGFWEGLREAIQQHDLIGQILGPLLLAPGRLGGYQHLIELPPGLLNLGDYGLLETVRHWQGQFPGTEFVLFNDHSDMVEKNRELWEAILDPSNPIAVVGQDRRTISFPLPVRGLRLEDSRQFSQLQVADVIAGATRAVLAARVNGSHDEYHEALFKAGLSNAWIDGVWPTSEVTPEGLGTTDPPLRDAAEFIATLVERHRRLESE